MHREKSITRTFPPIRRGTSRASKPNLHKNQITQMWHQPIPSLSFSFFFLEDDQQDSFVTEIPPVPVCVVFAVCNSCWHAFFRFSQYIQLSHCSISPQSSLRLTGWISFRKINIISMCSTSKYPPLETWLRQRDNRKITLIPFLWHRAVAAIVHREQQPNCDGSEVP